MAEFSEKLYSSSPPAAVRQRSRPSALFYAALAVFLVYFCTKLEAPRAILYPQRFVTSLSSADSSLPTTTDAICPQADALFPSRNGGIWTKTRNKTASSDFKARVVQLLAGAVQIPTESYDDMQPVGVDPRWAVFGEFHAYLERVFPLVYDFVAYANLKLRKINTYGLWFEWTGSNPALKPILLTAHQDVVPVDPITVDEWVHPPYSGYYDGRRIWGRGSADDKNGLIGVLTAIETLLEQDFIPTRTIVAAFGFDEEASGLQGAGELAKALLGAYGPDAFAFIIDEGDGIVQTFGTVVAFPCVAEKGYLDVMVEVTSPGGHSSAPPDHTTIGILAALIVGYEANPYPTQLSRTSTAFQTFQCIGQYGSTLPPAIKALIVDSAQSDTALHALEAILSKDKLYRSQIGTTQAVDVVSGGVKANALPEEARAIVNHRILAESSVAAVREHNAATLRRIAEQFNLSFTAFGVEVSEPGVPASGTLTLQDMYDALEPAPVTPTTGDSSAPYQLLSGSIKAAYETRRAANGDNSTVVVAPSIMTGNTDTQFYWNLTTNIFRYGHSNSAGLGPDQILDGIHTVNESIDADDFVEIIRFYITLLLNADESVVL
ncbi:Carboxypeptidase S [Mycena sanguinolenta]|uniref:Carboxypeptidase S n=1 Tax=Mycena sanguinolenta TaxID=230812 RepID=A0A8H7DL73_9AGAR|nr:Carboxypeptidase S [Mycena sanguinolenta]